MTAFIMIFLFVPETKQLSLEQLDDVFAIPTRTFVKHNVTKKLPWYFKTSVLRRKNVAPLEELYHFGKGVRGGVSGEAVEPRIEQHPCEGVQNS